jgi:hypothetical protein
VLARHEEVADVDDRADEGGRGSPRRARPEALQQLRPPISQWLECERPADLKYAHVGFAEQADQLEPGLFTLGCAWRRLGLEQLAIAIQDEGVLRLDDLDAEADARPGLDDLAYFQQLPLGLDLAGTLAAHVDRVVAVPAAAVITHLDQPWPDRRRWCVDRERHRLVELRIRHKVIAG